MTPVRILLIAHAPLAHALRDAALHVFNDCGGGVLALDVEAQAEPEDTLQNARNLLRDVEDAPLLVLTDIFGATPSNVALRLAEGRNARVLTGVNMPMLLRAWCYRAESLESVAARAQAGGTQGILLAGGSAPQNQSPRLHHDSEHRHDQQ
ncbi:PTS sugar transporter subunit IIA [Comamonas sp. GB3 AK4-5]|uniref:PTS sugar transporter subunit IIA n=1 Tax=Comamonas sp. GB3 AK4-5 TaxID=3231487 RepID=UPI00351E2908